MFFIEIDSIFKMPMRFILAGLKPGTFQIQAERYVTWAFSFQHSQFVTILQPIPLGVKFSNSVSKLKAQSSKLSVAMFQ